jgi:UDP-N-acetylglucosamine--N-acetylmuramyl-(pentapeptide) pyrophosphoryl-undecaprenol N-acetylglucosamine transferase
MPTLLVATVGGHLSQLVDIATRLESNEDNCDERVWVTHDHPQSRSLLAGERVVFVPSIGMRDVKGVLRNVAVAHRLCNQHRPTTAVSTGSGIALSFLPYLAARGVSSHYIESATRAHGPSLSGRLLRAAPRVRLYTQYRRLATARWRFRGTVFDGFTSVKVRDRRPLRRAVVTLGTMQNFTFRRLLEHLAPLLRPGGEFDRQQSGPVETVWQTGGTPADGLSIAARPWLSARELDAAMSAADVVVSHAGVGSALAALRSGHRPVLVPREATRGENCDDHQEHLARELADRGLALHRRVDELSIDDLDAAAAHRVERAPNPPPFELAP